MMSINNSSYDLENSSNISLKTFIIVLLAVTTGLLTAVIVLPAWLPGLAASLLGPDAKVYWYLSRGSAIVAYCLLWLSMALGLSMTNKMARLWPGAPAAYELHQFVSLIGLSFVLAHALLLIGDRYINISLLQVLTPFASLNYAPLAVGIGQIGFYLWLVLILSFYVRRVIGTRTWRVIHATSFIAFLFAMLHGITSGTDTGTLWMQAIYWLSAGSLLFMTIYRILGRLLSSQPALKPQPQKET